MVLPSSRKCNRSIGFHTGVRVSSTPVAELSSLFADQHCGEGAKVVLYMRPGSVLSRSFTAKDTHTPRGELVVVYGDARQSYRDAEIARETAAVSYPRRLLRRWSSVTLCSLGGGGAKKMPFPAFFFGKRC